MQGMAAQRQSGWEVATALGLIVHQEPHLLQAYIATLSVSSSGSQYILRGAVDSPVPVEVPLTNM